MAPAKKNDSGTASPADAGPARALGDHGHATWRAVSLLLAVGLLVSSIIALAKLATASGVPPLALSFWQCLGGGFLLLLLTLVRARGFALDGRHLRYYAIAGLTGFALPHTLVFFAVTPLGAGLASVAYAFPPLFTYALTLLLRMDRLVWHRALGILLGLAGVLLILLPRGSLPSPDLIGWMLVVMAAPLSLALGNVYRTLDWPGGASGGALAAGMMLGSAVLVAPVMLLVDGPYLPQPLAQPGHWAVVVQAVVTGLTYLLFFELQRIAGPVYLSQIGYVITATGLIAGMVFFGERYSLWVWIAVALIFLGIALNNLRRRRES